ncbi:MAG: 2-oxo acid dehydrogenase subunit E2 [Bacteroidetes bacterium]|nr:2-oxo acid dehydrogenase subunit E2 [Bacteroidota bacterium]
MIPYQMPSLGADMESGFLREWKVKPGDTVKRGDIIAEVETQKGIIDIEVFDDGIMGELLIKVDDKVPVGTLMTHILTKDEAAAGIKPEKLTVQQAATAVSPPPVQRLIKASPLARKIAEEKGIDLASVKGTGPDGAITREDVERTTQKTVPAERSVSENVRMAVAAAMSKSNREIPHYYLDTTVDMTKSLTWMAEANKKLPLQERLLPVVLILKAAALACREVPDLNAWWENGLVWKDHVNLGFVVSLRSGGLMVPSINDADQKSLSQLMASLNDVIPRARAMKLKSSELVQTTLTVTSLGEGAVESVYGVIYPPQVAILGFGGIHEAPWAENGMLEVRKVMTITLAADHRATDGQTGNRFLLAINKNLQQPEKL